MQATMKNKMIQDPSIKVKVPKIHPKIKKRIKTMNTTHNPLFLKCLKFKIGKNSMTLNKPTKNSEIKSFNK